MLFNSVIQCVSKKYSLSKFKSSITPYSIEFISQASQAIIASTKLTTRKTKSKDFSSYGTCTNNSMKYPVQYKQH